MRAPIRVVRVVCTPLHILTGRPQNQVYYQVWWHAPDGRTYSLCAWQTREQAARWARNRRAVRESLELIRSGSRVIRV